jgi:hypothetical protein
MRFVATKFTLFSLALLFLVSGCSEKPIEGGINKIFGYWQLSKIIYSNSTSSYDNSPNYSLYYFTSDYVTNKDNISNYSGYIYGISSFVITNSVVSNTWGVDLRNNKLYIYTDSTNYVYTFSFVANNSDDINEIWLSQGVFSVSNTNYSFFVSNGIVRYVLKKK